MRKLYLIPIIMIALAMSSTMVFPKAISDVASAEIKMAAQTGLFIQIVESHEEHLIEEVIKQYFEPLYDEVDAVRFANVILEELLRYDLEVVRKMNIRLYLVNALSNVAGVTFMTKQRDFCDIYVSTAVKRSEYKERMTLHHELFHCFDHEENIADWSAHFVPSPHVTKTWGSVENEAVTVDFAGEERAEYFAWMLIHQDNRFEDDVNMDQKQQMMLLSIDKLIIDTSDLPPKKTYLIRTWSGGKVSAMSEVLIDGSVLRQYDFDYLNNHYTVIDRTKNQQTIVPLQ